MIASPAVLPPTGLRQAVWSHPGLDRERARDGRRGHLARIDRDRRPDHGALDERRENGQLLILIDLAEAASNECLSITEHVVCKADTRTDGVLGLLGGRLVVVADPEVEGQLPVHLPLIGDAHRSPRS